MNKSPKTLDKLYKWQATMMKKHGWYVHYVTDHDDNSPTGYNVHTHGLTESHDHPDLQIVMPIRPEIAHSLLIATVDLIKSGIKIDTQKEYDKIVKDFKVRFTVAVENEREVLRMILPDAQGNLEKKNMKGMWRKQWDGC
jgi:hypothetical protein